MIAAPWYLLAVGIGLFILGYLVAGLGSSGGKPRMIDPRMRDKDIIKNLQADEAPSLAGVLVFLGYLLVFISIVWRLARYFV